MDPKTEITYSQAKKIAAELNERRGTSFAGMPSWIIPDGRVLTTGERDPRAVRFIEIQGGPLSQKYTTSDVLEKFGFTQAAWRLNEGPQPSDWDANAPVDDLRSSLEKAIDGCLFEIKRGIQTSPYRGINLKSLLNLPGSTIWVVSGKAEKHSSSLEWSATTRKRAELMGVEIGDANVLRVN